MIKSKEKENLPIIMEIIMMEIGLIIKKKDSEYTIGLIKHFIKENI